MSTFLPFQTKSFSKVLTILVKLASQGAENVAQLARKQDFRDRNYIAAMNKFNRTLALAEKGTSNMGFAYGNRSACFLDWKIFHECLHDIKKSNYSRNQLTKL